MSEQKELQLAIELKRKADLKQSILQAVQHQNPEELVTAVQRLRYTIMDFDKINASETRERMNNLHVKDGTWRKQFEKFLQDLEQDTKRPQPLGVSTGEIYFDGPSRFCIRITLDGKIIPMPVAGGISDPLMVGRWSLIENSYTLYYGKDGDPKTSSISPEMKEYLEQNTPPITPR